MIDRLRDLVVGLALVALCGTILAPSVSSAQTPPRAGRSPLEYPLSGRAALAAPQLPQPKALGPAGQSRDIAGAQPQQPGPPSPLLGQAPPLPLSLPLQERVRNDPALLKSLQGGLKPVSSARAPLPPVGGSWQLGPSAPGLPPLSSPLLLTDGTVIAHMSCSGSWWKLTPDSSGSYVNGAWSQIAAMPAGYAPRFFSSAVLPDGRVIAEGGEYNTTNCTSVWTTLGAIYDPLADSWASVTPPSGWGNIGDAQSVVLPNGTYMQADCCATLQALLNPATLTWTATGTSKFDVNDEEGWTLLPTGSVMAVDAYVSTGACNRNSELYAPLTGAWTSAGNTPAQLSDCSNATNKTFEIGPHALRPDGTMIAFGGTTCGLCASTDNSVVTPTAIFNSTNSTWSPGPNLPAAGGNNQTLADAPAVTLPSGNVLFAASPNYKAFQPPTNFFELDAATNTISQVAAPTDAASFNSFQWNLLALPNGQVMALETDGSNVWFYTPAGAPNAAWLPAVTTAPSSLVSGASYQLAGTQLNGLTQGAAYGDDVQAATNFPIVRIVNSASGHVSFARSSDFSTMAVTPGASGTATFVMPQAVEPGPSSLSVIASGIASAPVSLNVQRGLYAAAPDFNFDGTSDILWRSTSGELVMWEMSAGAVAASLAVETVGNDWSVVGTGDFNSDGNSDILWRNKNGTVAIWEMNGPTIVANVGGQVVSNDWVILGTGDFFGAGRSNCILWRNSTTGTVVIWQMNGGVVAQSLAVQTVSNDWTIVGIGDFNSDGKSDLVWRNANGTVLIWEMNGAQVIATVAGQVVSGDWTIIGTGDFFGAGHANCLLWRNANGQIVLWRMNGGAVVSNTGVQTVSNDWSIVGVGDFNHDGKSDILWRNTNGTVAIWEMNGASVIGNIPGQTVSPFLFSLLQ